FFSSRRRHTRSYGDWSSDVCSSDLVPADEVIERLVAVAVVEVGPQHPLDDGRRLVGRDGAEDLAAEVLVGPVAAADEDVVAFDRLVAGLDLGAEQADVAEVVLGAGVRAAGQVDVDGLIQLDPALDVLGDGQGVALGVRRGELAAGVASAGD